MSETPPYSKKGQRVVSSFVGQELLFDYITDQLDEERKKAVAEFVQRNKDAQMDILKIQNGMIYTQKLGETKVSEALLEKVTLPASYLEVMIQKTRFEEWSPAFKLAIEGTIVALGVISLVILVPWHRLMDLKLGPKEVILAEIDNEYAKKVASESDTSVKEEESFPDEGAPAAAIAKNTTTTTLPSPVTAVAETMVPDKKAEPAPTVVAAKNNKNKNSEPVAVTAKTQNSETTGTSSGAEAPEKAVATVSSNEKKAIGELYRGRVDVTNVPAISPKLVDKIAELGGRKAGQVELGWNKGGSSYFHFTMPQSRYDELVEYFKEYGNLKIQKEKHERVMPEGVMRLIITVEEKR
jgi:hypothetical protein